MNNKIYNCRKFTAFIWIILVNSFYKSIKLIYINTKIITELFSFIILFILRILCNQIPQRKIIINFKFASLNIANNISGKSLVWCLEKNLFHLVFCRFLLIHCHI